MVIVAVLGVLGLAVVASVAAYLRVREPAPPATLNGFDPAPLTDNAADRGGASLAVAVADPGLASAGARWYFNWSYRPHTDVDLEFVPLVCGYPGNGPVTDTHLDLVRAAVDEHPEDYPEGTLFLVGNEIGYKAQNDGRTPVEYAEDFRRCYELLTSLNPTFQVSVGPAILTQDERITRDQVGADNGVDYLAKVIAAYRNAYGEPIPADYFAATGHVLRGGAAGVAEFRNGVTRLRQMLAAAGLRDRRVIITEFGVPLRGSTPAEIAEFMKDSIDFVATAADEGIGCPGDDQRLVQRWAWFTARPLPLAEKLRTTGLGALVVQFAQTSLFDLDGRPTHLGRMYAELMGGDLAQRR